MASPDFPETHKDFPLDTLYEYNDFIDWVKKRNGCSASGWGGYSLLYAWRHKFCPSDDTDYDLLSTFELDGVDGDGNPIQWTWEYPIPVPRITVHYALIRLGSAWRWSKGAVFSMTNFNLLAGLINERTGMYAIPAIYVSYIQGGVVSDGVSYHVYLFEKMPDPEDPPDDEPPPDDDPEDPPDDGDVEDPPPVQPKRTKQLPVFLQMFQNLVMSTQNARPHTTCPPCPDVFLETSCPPCPDVTVEIPPCPDVQVSCPPCPDVEVSCPPCECDCQHEEPGCQTDCDVLCDYLVNRPTAHGAMVPPPPGITKEECVTKCEQYIEETCFEDGDIDVP